MFRRSRIVCSIQDWLGQSGDAASVRLSQFEHDDFVAASLQPRTRTIQRLMRPDIPKASQVVTIDPDNAFPPRTEIEKSVTDGLQAEPGAMKRRAFGRLIAKFETVEMIRIQRKTEGGPAGEFTRVRTSDQFHLFRDAFSIVQKLAVVHSSERFDQNVERRLARAGGKRD